MRIDREQIGHGQMIHKVIADAAKGITEAVFEACSQSDRFHAKWGRRRRRFIQTYWSQYIGAARECLTTLLQPIPGTENDPDGPKYGASQYDRDKIFEALLIDGQYKRPAPITTDQFRMNAGFDPIAEVMKSKHGAVVH